MAERTFTALFPFCGLGAGARGFLDAQVSLLGTDARFVSLGGIDIDELACADFEALTESPALCADLATMQPAELRTFTGARAPDVVFMSPPCKGFSGLLSTKRSHDERYQRMNRLAVDCVRLLLSTWPGPPGLVLFENVPRIASRGAPLLREVRRLLRAAGYVFHDGHHDCGELGGLAQRRRRYLLVARHARRVPPLLYQPQRRRVRGCGEVLGELPMPEEPSAGPLHKLPRISWLNWIRLALIPAGGDWRDLPGVLDGAARRSKFERLAIVPWDEATGTVAGAGSNGVYGVADPRLGCEPRAGVYGVLRWEEPASAVTGVHGIDNAKAAIADPRISPSDGRHWNKYRVEAWDAPARAVIGATRPGSGAPAIADPRIGFAGSYGVLAWDEAAGTITGNARPPTGPFSVADVRVDRAYDHGYRVLRWDEPSFTVHGKSHPGNGAYTVADPRKAPPFIPVIIADDGTWHRPLTTLELAALQGIPTRVRGEPLRLAGSSVSGWRERIGNAVPPPAARAIAEQMLVTLVHAELESFALSNGGAVWVEPVEART